MDTTILNIHNIRLEVISADNVINWYEQRSRYEESVSTLYGKILVSNGTSTFIDVGANYGFNSIIANKYIENLQTYTIEADPKLIPLIQANFKHNLLPSPHITHAICGKDTKRKKTFSLNPHSSLDNRVTNTTWRSITVPQVSIDNLLSNKNTPNNIFIKIDTQGYEAYVIFGAKNTLEANKNWLLKMEFAPFWMSSQNVKVHEFFTFLTKNFEVAECPGNLPYAFTKEDDLFTHLLSQNDGGNFIKHVTSLNNNQKGWIDLYIRPNKKNNPINWAELENCI